ncbi:hypothetical protein Tco_1102285 [Tanacetum coccineum]
MDTTTVVLPHDFIPRCRKTARNWFSKNYLAEAWMGFEELRRASFCLKFYSKEERYQETPIELARVVKQRKGGPNKRPTLNDRVHQNFVGVDERTRSLFKEKATADGQQKRLLNNRSQVQSGRQSNDRVAVATQLPRSEGAVAKGIRQVQTSLQTMTHGDPRKQKVQTSKTPPLRHSRRQRLGNGLLWSILAEGHTTNECVQLRQLN